MPTHDDAPTLWKAWVEVYGGEGIVLKDRAWQKLKQRLTVDVQVLECGDALIEWGDWAHAAMLTMTYWHPRQEDHVMVRQAVRVPNPADWRPRTGLAAVLCWGLFSGRLLRHPVFVGWR
jgi:hypothetical protein